MLFLVRLWERFHIWVPVSIRFQKIHWLLLQKSCKWSVVNVGQITHAHEKYAPTQRHIYRVQSFRIVMGACAAIPEQWMNAVLWRWQWCWGGWWQRLCGYTIKMSFFNMILPDSSIYKIIIKCILKHVLFLFLTGLYDLLRCYWKISKNQVIDFSWHKHIGGLWILTYLKNYSYLGLRSGLYVIMSRTRFRVSLRSLVFLMSRNSLLKTGAISEV